MADLADSIDDLICTFDANTDYEMDTLAMFLFGWILTALFILWLSKAIYNRFILKESAIDSTSKTKSLDTVKPLVKTSSSEAKENNSVKQIFSGVSSGKSGGGGGVSSFPQPPLRKRLSQKGKSPVPDLKKSHFYPAPQCTGADNIAVLWVNDVFQWLYNDLVIVNELFTEWLRSMNEFSKQALEEVSIIFSFGSQSVS